MKQTGVRFLINETFLTLSVSLLLWVMSLLGIYFIASNFLTAESGRPSADGKRIAIYHEESAAAAR